MADFLNSDKIVCGNCGWSWLVVDGGHDLYICHSCGHDNEPHYFSNFIDPRIVSQGISSATQLTSQIAESSRSKKMSFSDFQKEVRVVCGKRIPKLKKKRKVYDDCVSRLLDDRMLERQQKAKIQKQIIVNENLKQVRNTRNKTLFLLGLTFLIIGLVVYKKNKK